MPRCDECGSTDVTKVWEDAEDYQAGKDPDYIGCNDCEAEMKPA